MPRNLRKGFTLIELLVVIGILGILLAIVLIAINPARQFALSNNTKRSSDVNTILNAISQYMVDKHGVPPANLTTTPTDLANTGTDICSDLVPKYVAQLPLDPSKTTAFTDCTTYDTGYLVSKDSNGRVTVTAGTVDPVDGVSPTISVTR